jgi:hypothetical protein
VRFLIGNALAEAYVEVAQSECGWEVGEGILRSSRSLWSASAFAVSCSLGCRRPVSFANCIVALTTLMYISTYVCMYVYSIVAMHPEGTSQRMYVCMYILLWPCTLRGTSQQPCGRCGSATLPAGVIEVLVYKLKDT